MDKQPDFDPTDPAFLRGLFAYEVMSVVSETVEKLGPLGAELMLSLALEQAKAELARKLERTN